jgi:hypothetical protein
VRIGARRLSYTVKVIDDSSSALMLPFGDPLLEAMLKPGTEIAANGPDYSTTLEIVRDAGRDLRSWRRKCGL